MSEDQSPTSQLSSPLAEHAAKKGVGGGGRYITLGDRIPVEARYSAPVQTGCGDHPASYTVGTRSFPEVKRPGHGVDHPPPSSAEVKERVELYISSPAEPSWFLHYTLLMLPVFLALYLWGFVCVSEKVSASIVMVDPEDAAVLAPLVVAVTCNFCKGNASLKCWTTWRLRRLLQGTLKQAVYLSHVVRYR